MSTWDTCYAPIVRLVQLVSGVGGEPREAVAVALHSVAPCVADLAVQLLVVLGAVQRVQGLATVLWKGWRGIECGHGWG